MKIYDFLAFYIKKVWTLQKYIRNIVFALLGIITFSFCLNVAFIEKLSALYRIIIVYSLFLIINLIITYDLWNEVRIKNKSEREKEQDSSEPGVGTRQEVLEHQPEVKSKSQIEGNEQFIYEEIKKLFHSNNKEYDCLDDHIRANDFKNKGECRPAATLYIRIFTPVAELLKDINCDEIAEKIKFRISQLKQWSQEGHGEDDFTAAVGGIYREMNKLFQEPNN